MKEFKFSGYYFLGIIAIGMLAILLICANQKPNLAKGDISFVALNAVGKDSFSIKIHKVIAPNTTIQFTDAEWNGRKFGKDESNMVWNSGNKAIKVGTIIHFGSNGKEPIASVGTVNNSLKISKNKDAIFAYIGRKRQPKYFLAAIANHPEAYGTLEHTGLEEGITAKTLSSKAASYNLVVAVEPNTLGL